MDFYTMTEEAYKSGYKDGQWEVFSLITSVYFGKGYYFKERHGMVYSRHSHEYLTFDEALDEFLDHIRW